MSNDLLAKLKGYKNTFVVHSNTSPYAAVAAMGAMMGRSQEAGAYFHFSEELIPTIQAPGASGSPTTTASGNLTVDFKADWVRYVREIGLPACDLKFDEPRGLEENTMRLLNAFSRRIPSPQPRTVHESRELSIPQEYEQDYSVLKEAIRSGCDLRPYLSRDIIKKGKPDRNDGLLNSWGIQHLHFRTEGTGHLLFCKITASDVFAIQVLPHDEDGLWVNEQLMQILHDNWPEEIASGRLHGIPAEAHARDKRVELRGYNANFVTTTKDGTQYLAPGGGLMASGDCAEDRLNCDKIFSELKYWQEVTEKGEAEIRSSLGWFPSQHLFMKMMFDNRKFCIYEPTKGIRIAFNVSASS
jgi:hypothetical protein